MTKDPLLYFYQIYGFDKKNILRLSLGSNYVGIMLKNGNIGVAATLKNNIDADIKDFVEHDFDNYSHRAMLTAYYNAILNYDCTYNKEVDIFDELQFGGYKKLVMVGLFESLHRNLLEVGVKVDVFDASKQDARTKPMEKQEKIMQNADAAIITSTTVINGSFSQLMQYIPANCEIFMLGPSGILSNDMFKYGNIRYIFGSVFDNADHKVMDAIEAGAGTRGFLQYLHKVFIKNPS